MSKATNLILLIALLLTLSTCDGQNNSNKTLTSDSSKEVVGGPFENGSFMYINMPKHIKSVDTSAGWKQDGQPILITGTIFKIDGKTPAPNVILYYYHTDISGRYVARKGLGQKVKKHGYIRGWVQSDEAGKYSIYTVRPAPYPNSNEPAHIHLSIKEPKISKEYYIDGLVFDDDKLLTSAKRKALSNRGGSGVLRILKTGNLQIAEKNIILGLNIPNYPEKIEALVVSGKDIGEDVFSFRPFHAWGRDKGKRTCPVCKYGRYHGVLYFVGNQPDWEEIKSWLTFLENESRKRKKYLKVYFVYGNEKGYSEQLRSKELAQIGSTLKLKNIALTYVPSFSDKESEVDLNRINPEVNNTFLIYKNRNVVDKFINLKAEQKNFDLISKRLDETEGAFFDLGF